MKQSLLLTLLLFIFLLSACTDAKTQSLKEFYNDADIDNVERAVITDGSSGASKTISTPKKIKEFLSLINDIEFSPRENQEERKGWRYRITLFDGEKEFDFTLSQIGDTYYNSDPDIHPIVKQFYEQLEMEE